MKGFQKIEIGKPSLKAKPTVIKKYNLKAVKILFTGLIGILIIAFIVVLALFIPGKELYLSFQKTAIISQEAYSAAKNQDIEQTSVKLKELEENLSQVEKKFAVFSWLKYIPVLGVYESDGEHLIKASIAGVSAGKIAVETVVPYADLLGLKGKSTFVSGSADERIQTAVAALDKVTPKLEEISQKLVLVGQELSQVDPERYPKKISSFEVRSKLKLVKDLFSENAKLFIDAQPLLAKVPELLGSKTPQTYLVIFQNDAELRATGGFITAYAIFKIDKGKIQVIKADDIYKLDEAKKKKFSAPKSILKYHQNVSYLELRDSNLSPDFVVSMKDFENMLKEGVPDFPKFDGIIALDTHVLVSSIRILGEFNIYGRVFNVDNDSRCDCPKAIYELEDYSTRPVAYVRGDRKDIIGVLLYQIMQRALGVSPSKYWGNLFQMFLEEAREKHILFYFHNEEAQKGIEALNFAGRIIPFEGDYLHVNNVNFAGAKSNLFIKDFVKQEIRIADDGTITKILSLTYKNPAPASNCNLEAGQLCLNGILRNWLRVYVPKGSTLVEFTGSEKDTQVYEELGKTVLEGFFTVKPQGAAEVRLSYKLPFNAASGEPYQILIQKQPGTDVPEYTISINGKEKDKFSLTTDRQISTKK